MCWHQDPPAPPAPPFDYETDRQRLLQVRRSQIVAAIHSVIELSRPGTCCLAIDVVHRGVKKLSVPVRVDRQNRRADFGLALFHTLTHSNEDYLSLMALLYPIYYTAARLHTCGEMELGIGCPSSTGQTVAVVHDRVVRAFFTHHSLVDVLATLDSPDATQFLKYVIDTLLYHQDDVEYHSTEIQDTLFIASPPVIWCNTV